MNSKEDKILIKLEAFVKNDLIDCKDEISLLIKEYKRKSKRLETIIKISDTQQNDLLRVNEELDDYKNHLEEKVKEEVDKRQHQDRILLQQSKLAAMGEMIDAIAHQWKQPLNIINMKVASLCIEYDFDAVDKDYMTQFSKDISRQVKHMANTIDEFRSFLKPDKNIQEFDVKKLIETTLTLIEDEFKAAQVNIVINEKESMRLNAVENEFQHIIINLLNNSKDAFIEKNMDNRQIVINIFKDRLEIIDNAGGIPDNIIKDIFKVSFTTKKTGSGAGLYMSQLIAKKSQGHLIAQNTKDGAMFTFELKAQEDESSL